MDSRTFNHLINLHRMNSTEPIRSPADHDSIESGDSFNTGSSGHKRLLRECEIQAYISLCFKSVDIITDQSSKLANQEIRLTLSTLSVKRTVYIIELEKIQTQKESQMAKVFEMYRLLCRLSNNTNKNSTILSNHSNQVQSRRNSRWLEESIHLGMRREQSIHFGMRREHRRHDDHDDDRHREIDYREQLRVNLKTIRENGVSLKRKYDRYIIQIEELSGQMILIVEISRLIDSIDSEIDYYKRMIKQELEVLKSNK